MASSSVSQLIPPCGGRLTELLIRGQEREALLLRAAELPSLQLSPRSLCSLELLATGVYSPLETFLGKSDYECVLRELRLRNGALCPIPVILPVRDAANVPEGQEVTLRSPSNEPVAVLRVDEVYERDLSRETEILGTAGGDRTCVSGKLSVLSLPRHFDFPRLRRSPAEVRKSLENLGNARVLAFELTDWMHRGEEERCRRAAEREGASLLLQVTAGLPRAGDMDYYMRIRTCATVFDHHFDRKRTALNLISIPDHAQGVRGLLWRAMIHRNYGAGLLAIEPGSPVEDAKEHLEELGVRPVECPAVVYLPEEGRYEEAEKSAPGAGVFALSGTEVRNGYLAKGEKPPEWLMHSDVAEALSDAYPPRKHQGFCVWFTGLPSSGKSTIADILATMLMERGRQVTVLDGDVVRTHLSKGLGFSKEDRDMNILRIGFVAAEIVRHHGAVICAAVSPYRETRERVRAMVGADRFLECYVATPVEVCEKRDVKKLYTRARAGELKGFTGVDDPYEPPLNPQIMLPTTEGPPEQSARKILDLLIESGFLPTAAEGNER